MTAEFEFISLYNEIEPLQERMKELNDWLGVEVIRFNPYVLS
jgi:hypothetical protein